MGQLINPISFRLNKNKFWIIKWTSFSKSNFKYILKDDYFIFSFLNFLFYRLKKLLKKKFFFLIIDFIVLKKNNYYIFSLDYLFLSKFYKKYFKNNKINILSIKNNSQLRFKKRQFSFIFHFFKNFFKKLKIKENLTKNFKLIFHRNIKRLRKKRKKKYIRKRLYRKKILNKKYIIFSKNFYKKFLLLLFIKNLKKNVIALIILFFIFYKKKINFFFINNPFFLFKFVKSFLILNIKKFLKNNLSLNLCNNFLIKLKNVKNIFKFKKFESNKKNLKKFLFSKDYNFYNNKILNYNLKKKIKSLKVKNFYRILKRTKFSKNMNKNKFNFLIKNKNFILDIPLISDVKKRKFTFSLNKIYNRNIKYLRTFSLNIILNKIFLYKKNKKFIIKSKKRKKKIFKKLKKKKLPYILFNFNLRIFSLFFKFLFKKHRFNINRILKLLVNKLIIFIKNKTFIKGFKIKIKGRFTKKSRTSISIKNVGKYSLSKLANKIIFFEENILTIYGISSFKLFFLVDNNFYNKKSCLNKKLFDTF